MNNSELINSVDLSKLSVRTVADQLIELAEQGNPYYRRRFDQGGGRQGLLVT